MVDVYHEFSEPVIMMQHIQRAEAEWARRARRVPERGSERPDTAASQNVSSGRPLGTRAVGFQIPAIARVSTVAAHPDFHW